MNITKLIQKEKKRLEILLESPTCPEQIEEQKFIVDALLEKAEREDQNDR